MLFVILRSLFNTLFAQLLRLGQATRPQTVGVITVNYLVATLASLVLAGIHGRVRYLPPTVGFGLLGGVGYITSILLMMLAMRRSGVSVAVAVLQLAVLVPVAFAMVVFGELPSRPQWIGIAAATAALALLSAGRTLKQEQKGVRFSPLLIVLFFVTGISGIAMKAFHEYAPAPELPGFMTVLFATATAGGAVAGIALREPWARADLVLGTAVGLTNAAQLVFLLRAMETVPAIVVFPVSSALTLVLNAVAAICFWGERLDRPTGLGLVLALAATFLLNR